ncbi:conserved Plasmodium membrane protein, unknown function [Plasmodium sp. gorilla clade G3]|nr:conserved Plasmodium membrane protein, unknown function [Plasmodium sp. gorilla clade G3]
MKVLILYFIFSCFHIICVLLVYASLSIKTRNVFPYDVVENNYPHFLQNISYVEDNVEYKNYCFTIYNSNNKTNVQKVTNNKTKESITRVNLISHNTIQEIQENKEYKKNISDQKRKNEKKKNMNNSVKTKPNILIWKIKENMNKIYSFYYLRMFFENNINYNNIYFGEYNVYPFNNDTIFIQNINSNNLFCKNGYHFIYKTNKTENNIENSPCGTHKNFFLVYQIFEHQISKYIQKIYTFNKILRIPKKNIPFINTYEIYLSSYEKDQKCNLSNKNHSSSYHEKIYNNIHMKYNDINLYKNSKRRKKKKKGDKENFLSNNKKIKNIENFTSNKELTNTIHLKYPCVFCMKKAIKYDNKYINIISKYVKYKLLYNENYIHKNNKSSITTCSFLSKNKCTFSTLFMYTSYEKYNKKSEEFNNTQRLKNINENLKKSKYTKKRINKKEKILYIYDYLKKEVIIYLIISYSNKYEFDYIKEIYDKNNTNDAYENYTIKNEPEFIPQKKKNTNDMNNIKENNNNMSYMISMNNMNDTNYNMNNNKKNNDGYIFYNNYYPYNTEIYTNKCHISDLDNCTDIYEIKDGMCYYHNINNSFMYEKNDEKLVCPINGKSEIIKNSLKNFEIINRSIRNQVHYKKNFDDMDIENEKELYTKYRNNKRRWVILSPLHMYIDLFLKVLYNLYFSLFVRINRYKNILYEKYIKKIQNNKNTYIYEIQDKMSSQVMLEDTCTCNNDDSYMDDDMVNNKNIDSNNNNNNNNALHCRKKCNEDKIKNTSLTNENKNEKSYYYYYINYNNSNYVFEVSSNLGFLGDIYINEEIVYPFYPIPNDILINNMKKYIKEGRTFSVYVDQLRPDIFNCNKFNKIKWALILFFIPAWLIINIVYIILVQKMWRQMLNPLHRLLISPSLIRLSFYILLLMFCMQCPYVNNNCVEYTLMGYMALNTMFSTIFHGNLLLISKGYMITRGNFDKKESLYLTLIISIIYIITSINQLNIINSTPILISLYIILLFILVYNILSIINFLKLKLSFVRDVGIDAWEESICIKLNMYKVYLTVIIIFFCFEIILHTLNMLFKSSSGNLTLVEYTIELVMWCCVLYIFRYRGNVLYFSLLYDNITLNIIPLYIANSTKIIDLTVDKDKKTNDKNLLFNIPIFILNPIEKNDQYFLSRMSVGWPINMTLQLEKASISK